MLVKIVELGFLELSQFEGRHSKSVIYRLRSFK